jgi:primosomal protein N' (replication factor Y)
MPDRAQRHELDGEQALRAVVRVPRPAGGELARSLRQLQALRSARKLPAVRVQVDPVALG